MPARSRTSAPSWTQLPSEILLSDAEVERLRTIGDNTGSHGAEGRQPRLRGAGGGRSLEARRGALTARRALGDRTPARPRQTGAHDSQLTGRQR